MLDVSKLVLLREVALQGSLTAAARALKVSTSNISQRLQRLETEAGTPLLLAEGRGVRLTGAAYRLIAHTETVLEALELAEIDLDEARSTGLVGTIRLVAFHSFAVGLMASVSRHLREIAPNVTIKFTQLEPDDAIAELLARRADIAVSDEYPGYALKPRPGVLQSVIAKESIRAYVPEQFASLEEAPWAMEPSTADAGRWALEVCRTAGFEANVNFISPDPYLHRSLLEQGMAAAFLPASVTPAPTCRIRVIDELPDTMHRRIVTLIRRGSEHSPIVAACHDAIRAAVAESQADPASHAD
ncbi:MAG: LysR family transcriptional regulator [Agrococcus casei]|uniref:LysR family transcriptional regulator n=3 Tax=Agrococcus casei TaxID=343512 RepID=UPI003F9D6096